MGGVSNGEEEMGKKEEVGGVADGEEKVGRDGEQFWVGPINVSCQKQQPAPDIGGSAGIHFDPK